MWWWTRIVLRTGNTFGARLCDSSLCCRCKHETWLAAHLLLEGMHGTHLSVVIFVFRRGFSALAWLNSYIFFHFFLPHRSIALVIAWQFTKTSDRGLFHHVFMDWLIVTWAQTVARVEQEVLFLIKLCDLSRDSHCTKIHLVKIIFTLGRTWRRLSLFLRPWFFIFLRFTSKLTFYLNSWSLSLSITKRIHSCVIRGAINWNAGQGLGNRGHFVHRDVHVGNYRIS